MSAQVPDVREHFLLMRVWLNLFLVRAEPVAVRNISNALTTRFLMPHRIPRALADRLSFPLADGRHDIDYEPTSR